MDNRTNLLYSDTDAGRREREKWLKELFSNPHVNAVDKVVLTAFLFWYYPAHKQEEGGEVLMDFEELQSLTGLSRDVCKRSLDRAIEGGLFSARTEKA